MVRDSGSTSRDLTNIMSFRTKPTAAFSSWILENDIFSLPSAFFCSMLNTASPAPRASRDVDVEVYRTLNRYDSINSPRALRMINAVSSRYSLDSASKTPCVFALKSDELRIRTGFSTNCGQNALSHTDSSQFISLHAVLVRGVSVLIVMSLNFLSAKHSSGNIPRRYAIVYTAVLKRFLTRTKDCARVTAFCLV